MIWQSSRFMCAMTNMARSRASTGPSVFPIRRARRLVARSKRKSISASSSSRSSPTRRNSAAKPALPSAARRGKIATMNGAEQGGRPGEGSDMAFGVGQPVTRKEDPRFLTGRGRYVADIDIARQTYAVFIHSPHAHANIKSIDVSAALAAPGIIAVLTGKDWTDDGLGTIGPEAMPEDFGGPKGYRTKHYPLAVDKVRYVGDRVALIIANSEAQARDAVELVNIDYEV